MHKFYEPVINEELIQDTSSMLELAEAGPAGEMLRLCVEKNWKNPFRLVEPQSIVSNEYKPEHNKRTLFNEED